MPTDETAQIPTPEQKERFWQSFLKASEVEPRSASHIKGASGLNHPVAAVGVDDARHRIVIVSRDAHPKAAALAQVDIQAANPGYQVVLARPVPINLGRLASAVAAFLGSDALNVGDAQRLSEAAKPEGPLHHILAALGPSLTGFEYASVDTFAIFHEILQQLALVEFGADTSEVEEGQRAIIRLRDLVRLDPTGADRAFGNCAVPLYDFEDADADVLHVGTDIESVRDVLRRKHLLQYFFPPADHLALGFAEKRASRTVLSESIAQSPLAGHPLGSLELLPAGTPVQDVIDELTERKLLVEGEYGYEISEAGSVVRAAIRFKPREGFLMKLSRILSLKIDIGPTNFLK